MDSNHLNVTRGLVRAILTLTAEQRLSDHLQSYCQTIYCLFLPEDPIDLNGTCHVVPKKFIDHPTTRSTIFVNFPKIFLYLYSIFIFMGILGNSCSCFIMFLNVRRYGYPANFYLTLLAFVDCLFLLGSAIPDWFSRLHGHWNIRLISDLSCRFVYWFGNFTTHLSAGLVVSVTIERFLAIQYPLLAHQTNSVRTTHSSLLILIVFFFLLDSRVFFLVQHIRENIHVVQTCPNQTDVRYSRHDTFRCDIPRLHWRNTWIWVDFAVYTLIPFLIIVTLNSLIICRLIIAQRSRQKMSQLKNLYPMTENLSITRASDNERRRTRSVPPTPRQLTPSIDRPRTLRQCSSTSPSHRSSLRSNSQQQHNIRLTILLLLISCSFLLLTLPAVVINMIMTLKWKSSSIPFLHQMSHSIGDDDDDDDDELYYSLARLLMVINHSMNFILYLLVGKRFRRDLKRLCLHCFQRSL